MLLRCKVVSKIIDLFSSYIEKGCFGFLKKFSPYKLGRLFGSLHVIHLKNQLNKKGVKNVLCFDRFSFIRDLKILQKNGYYNYLLLSSYNFAKILSLYVPKCMRHQVLFHIYANEITNKEILEKITLFAEGFLDIVIKKIKIDIVMLAGIDYYGDYAFHLALKKKSIPFFALFYEHYTIKHFQQSNINLYKDFNTKFTGNFITCFGDKTAKVFEKSQVIENDKIFITGAPRYDIWKEIQIPDETLDSIILFSYPGIEYGAPLNFIFVLLEFAKASLKNKFLKYVIKCKDLSHLNQVQEILIDIKHNLFITIDTPVEDLLKRAKSVISFNSLSCIESLLSRANIYIPFFADSKLPETFLQIFPNMENQKVKGLFFINCPKQLQEVLEENKSEITNPLVMEESRVELFSKYFDFSKETTSVEKLEKLIKNTVST